MQFPPGPLLKKCCDSDTWATAGKKGTEVLLAPERTVGECIPPLEANNSIHSTALRMSEIFLSDLQGKETTAGNSTRNVDSTRLSGLAQQ